MEDTTSFLKEEFQRRRRVNKAYSLRSFSNYLNIPPGRLSELFSGKRSLTPSLVARLGKKLQLPEGVISSLQENATVDRDRSKARARLLPKNGNEGYQSALLPLDTFSILSDWYHFAILSLMDTRDFKPNVRWISERLAISQEETELALERMQRSGLLKSENGQLIKTHKNVSTTTDLESRALRHSHSQSLQQVIDCLDEVPLPERDVTSITLAINPKKLPEAKQAIAQFRKRMAQLLEGSDATEVYNLNIQLFPITRRKK